MANRRHGGCTGRSPERGAVDVTGVGCVGAGLHSGRRRRRESRSFRGVARASRETHAAELMADFARRTGLGGDAPPRRYLWTDAYAVRNFLDLCELTGEPQHRASATALIDAVHRVLGRHRPDSPQSGWLSGLPEEEGARHPTRGGLRIGKALPERGPAEPPDDRLEWDRDGQYFHYLTRWLETLRHAADVLGQPLYRRHAVELAAAVLPLFLRRDGSGTPIGITWKMSVDLTRPQVPGINPHDALDGYVAFRRIGGLDAEVALLAQMVKGQKWSTSDPLGLGGLLADAARLAELTDRTPIEERLIGAILVGVDAGLGHYLARDPLTAPDMRRLGFRELGLAIGLQALPARDRHAAWLGRDAREALASLLDRAAIGEEIVAYWDDRRQRQAGAWLDHRDINEVMLATALLGSGPRRAATGAA